MDVLNVGDGRVPIHRLAERLFPFLLKGLDESRSLLLLGSGPGLDVLKGLTEFRNVHRGVRGLCLAGPPGFAHPLYRIVDIINYR